MHSRPQFIELYFDVQTDCIKGSEINMRKKPGFLVNSLKYFTLLLKPIVSFFNI